MAEHHHPPTGREVPAPHAAGHQATDVNVRVLAWGAAILVVVTAAVCLFLFWLFGQFDAQLARDEQAHRVSAVTRPAAPPLPTPPLQGIPGYHNNTAAEDMAQMRRETASVLNSYGPADSQGFARIPIDRAMDLAVHTNLLPARPQPATKGAADADH